MSLLKQQTIETVSELIVKFSRYLDDETVRTFYENIGNIQSSIIPTQFVTEQALSDFWMKYIRPDTVFTRFVLKTISDLRFRYELSGESWLEYCRVLADTCIVAGSKSKVDPVFLERAVSDKKLVSELLIDNPWAVLVILVSFSTSLVDLGLGTSA